MSKGKGSGKDASGRSPGNRADRRALREVQQQVTARGRQHGIYVWWAPGKPIPRPTGAGTDWGRSDHPLGYDR